MAIRVDPRRLTLLKELAAAEGLRPGQLVQRWVEERLDAERSGQPAPSVVGPDPRVAAIEATLAALAARIDEVAQRMQTAPSEPAPRRRGRPPKARTAATSSSAAPPRSPTAASSRNGHVGLHDEIIAVIAERGPSTAAELAIAIRERGRYQPPRSSKPLDAATVNSRVSNPVYRARFRRSEGRIGLAD